MLEPSKFIIIGESLKKMSKMVSFKRYFKEFKEEDLTNFEKLFEEKLMNIFSRSLVQVYSRQYFSIGDNRLIQDVFKQ